jgi:hypothetical protein
MNPTASVIIVNLNDRVLQRSIRGQMKKTIVSVRLQKAIIHPFVFATFPILSLYVRNMGRGHLREAASIAIGAFIPAALLWLGVGLFVKNRDKSSIIVSVFCVLFFSYGHAISACWILLERAGIFEETKFLVQGKPALLSWLIVWGVLFAIAFYITVKLKSDLRSTTKVLNVVALTLMATVGVSSVAGIIDIYWTPRARAEIDAPVAGADSSQATVEADEITVDEATLNEFADSWQENMAIENVSGGNAVAGSLPDIYYIIPDMYVRSDYLEEIYGFDNSEFLSYLTQKGFYVADESRTNYPHTTHSLASSLNLIYLDDIAEQVGEEYTNAQPLITMIMNNKVFQYLRGHGYTIVAFSTGHEFTENKEVDVYMSPPRRHFSDFQRILLSTTPLIVLLHKTTDDFHRERVLYTFDHLADVAEIDAPVFVFAHILAPHPPYAFGPNGEHVRSKPHVEYECDEFIEAYRNQVAHTNKKIQAAIEDILSRSSEPPIIIIQGDHGSSFGGGYNIPERMSIFNAYYFPDHNYDLLYEDITPVNTFRVIFNNYFGTDYEILEDKSYYADFFNSPYVFDDITDQVLAGGLGPCTASHSTED